MPRLRSKAASKPKRREPKAAPKAPRKAPAKRGVAADAEALIVARAEAQAAIEEARRSHGRLREAIDMLPQGIVVLDAEGRYVLWNKEYADIYKRSADLFETGVKLEDTLRIGVARGDYPAAAGREEAWLAERLTLLANPRGRHEQRLSDGRTILIEERRTTDGGIIGLRVDISEMKRREASFRLLFDGNPVPMFVYALNGQRILAVNDAAIEHYGFERSALCKMTLGDLHDPTELSDLALLDNESTEEQAGRTWRQYKADGTAIDVALLSSRMTYEETPAVLIAAIDITERKRAEARIAFMAHHDALTSLPNRIMLRARMEEMLSRTKRDNVVMATLCIDLDNFKSVNDSLGHPAGDLLLRLVGGRLRGLLRDKDMVARLGGDEFAIVQGDVVDAKEIAELAERVLAEISQPFDLDGHQVTIGASIGIAFAPGDGLDADRLLKSADMAMYRAKAEGKGVYRFFESEMDAKAQARRRLELDLRMALQAEALELHYQPLVELASGEVTGYEALIRWPHAERGMIPPCDFIPVAEETGLIVPLGAFVLRKACADAVKWPEHIKVAVNLSPLQFKTGNLFVLIKHALESTGLSPKRLELEITETLLLEKSEHILATLHALRALGVRISMDDFGTGYSSLSYLRSFPFDKIKIDRSFVHDLGANADSQAIVRAIVSLGASLGITITAEGVETESDLAHLRAEGCAEGQGYLFAKARPQSDILATQAQRAKKQVA